MKVKRSRNTKMMSQLAAYEEKQYQREKFKLFLNNNINSILKAFNNTENYEQFRTELSFSNPKLDIIALKLYQEFKKIHDIQCKPLTKENLTVTVTKCIFGLFRSTSEVQNFQILIASSSINENITSR